MTILYQWQTRGDKPRHACSRWNGQIFYTADSLPELPVHPNCECVVRAFDTNAEALHAAAQNLTTIGRQSQEEAISLKPFMFIAFFKEIIF